MRKIIFTIIFAGVIFSCDDRLAEINLPTKNPTLATAETLFANGVNEMFYLFNNSSVNENVFRLYAQYWAQTQYPEESQYSMVDRRIPDFFWRRAYRDALKDLDEARTITEKSPVTSKLTTEIKNNRLAVIDINKVLVFSALIDAFGAAPYTEALNIKILSPKYDAGPDVYTKIIGVLDNAIKSITTTEGVFPDVQDPVYQGDAAAWLKFANSLKLRLAITIADADAAKAKTMVSEAIAGGVFTSNADNASITYLSSFPNTNPIWEDLVQSGRADYVVANTTIDKMNALSDPRIAVYAEPVGGIYVGGVYGSNNTYSLKSHIGNLFHQPDLEGLVMDYSEVEFMLAEAIERGFTVAGTAEAHYNAGITASMEYWGIAPADINVYLLNPAVSYPTAPGTWKQKIGSQQWLAYFNRGFEGWNVWRRLDFTGFNVPPLLTANDMPRRLIFPISEATLNKTNLQAAIQLIGGADNVQTKVFWDKF